VTFAERVRAIEAEASRKAARILRDTRARPCQCIFCGETASAILPPSDKVGHFCPWCDRPGIVAWEGAK
jgi:hypothetical protein